MISNNKIILIIILLVLNSCSYLTNPRPFGLFKAMNNQFPEGSSVFKDAWHNGCTSGLASAGPLIYKIAYKYEYDPEQINNREYYDTWKIAFRHCRWYVTAWTR